MFIDRLRGAASDVLRLVSCLFIAGVVWASPVAAQGTSGVLPASAPTAAPAASTVELTPAERAKRDADGVFRWITIHGEKTRKAPPKDDPAAAPAQSSMPSAAKPKPATRGPAQAPAEPAAAAVTTKGPKSKSEASVGGSTKATAGAASERSNGATGAAGSSGNAGNAGNAAALPSAAKETTAGTGATADSVGPQRAGSSSAAAPAVADAVEADEPLRPLSQAEPQFPASVTRNVRSGQVRVRFTVLPDGSVEEPTVVSSSNPRLNAAALAAVAQWRFAPLRRSQLAVVDVGFSNGE